MSSATLIEADGIQIEAPKMWCGCVDCNKFGRFWRTNTGSRKFWKTLSSLAFIAVVVVYIYSRRKFPAMVLIGVLWLVKNLVTIWGQDTPTVLAPGNPFVFALAYMFGIPSVVWIFAGCPGNGELVFPCHDIVGLVFFLFGLGYSCAYEVGRFLWKQRPENKGRCHTNGLASLSVHPNYFGDLFTYTGWTIAGGSQCGFSVAAFQMGLFLWFWIPSSDAYLAQRYLTEFSAYAARTPPIIPFVRSPFVNQVIAWIGLLYSLYASTRCGLSCS